MNSLGVAPFADIQAATRRHQAQHGCGAYTFEDGTALLALAATYKPTRILELGTALGYTACCLAQGSADAHVDTLEGDPEHVRLARKHIEEHRLTSRITVHHGQFADTLRGLTTGYDMAFFDGFAPPPNTLERLNELLIDGGILICSNLQLAQKEDADLLTTYLNDHGIWAALAPIESGRTVVRVKQCVKVFAARTSF